MRILHSEPICSAFTRLLKRRLESDDYIPRAHLFEEVSVLVLHRLLPEDLAFDAFAFDRYRDVAGRQGDPARVRVFAGLERIVVSARKEAVPERAAASAAAAGVA